MGRKSTLTKLIQSQIVEILEAGNYQKTAYESLGIPEATYFSWLKEGEKAESKERKLTMKEETYLDFLDSIKRAVQVARQKNLQCIQDATIGGAVLSETEYIVYFPFMFSSFYFALFFSLYFVHILS